MNPHPIQTDAKGRLNLGIQFASNTFLIEEVGDGEWMVRKAAVIPESELWFHRSKKAQELVYKGLVEAKKGKLKKNAIDLSE